MTDGDAETGDAAGEPAADAEAFEERLTDVEAALEAAETEADLDDVESQLDDVESDVEAADLPEPDEEDAEGPREELEAELETLREQLEDARGPYAADVVDDVEAASATIEDTRWTERGQSELRTTVEEFVSTVESTLDADVDASVGTDAETQTVALDAATSAVQDAGLDADEDATTIADLLDAAERLDAGVEDAQEWSDLTKRQQLQTEGFYDVLDHVRDYPPEWHALKVYEKQANAEMILLALETFTSNYMEKHCLDALKKLGDEAALEPMLQRAGKRDQAAIEVLGKIGSDEALDTILEYVDTPSNPSLQKTTMKALGEIGSEEATQEIANQLVAENENVRSHAARSLGLVGDTRAIDPLADVLAEDDSDTVRASAAWALNQIGTEAALAHLRDYADDRAYLVQSEAEKAV